MGKGDRKSKRGKIWRGTTGKRHRNNPKKTALVLEKEPPAEVKEKKKK
ncbi:MAG: 30S ribosomal protein THX [Deltaproteobacteria bacterium]|nr:30S ribosomal protein THX [Deltaproteobacteria bacterium]